MSSDLISSATSTPPVSVQGKTLGFILPGFLANVSSGASLTYNIEATGNDPAKEPNQANWVWTPMTNFTALTASIDGTLSAMPTYIRARITTYASGSLTFQVIIPSAK